MHVAHLGADNPYFAVSPTAEDPDITTIATGVGALNTDTDSGASPLTSMSSAHSVTSNSTGTSPRPYVSKIGILPSSLTTYHKAFMTGNIDPTAVVPPSEPPAPARTPAEQEETARRLRPHSRSQLRLDEVNKRPQGMTPVVEKEKKKSKAVRWQFGIRSRNAPREALVGTYKAWGKLGCGWQVDEEFDRVHGEK